MINLHCSKGLSRNIFINDFNAVHAVMYFKWSLGNVGTLETSIKYLHKYKLVITIIM